MYLSLAEAYLKSGHLREGLYLNHEFCWMDEKRGRGAIDLKHVEGMLRHILQEAANTQVDLDRDGISDPGELPVRTWIAKAFLERGEREEARKLLMLASAENPEDMETVRLLAGMKREDELNQTQAAKEAMKEKFVSSPFSRFNAAMALAYKLRRENLPSGLRKFGEKSLDYALELQPGVADAHLLKAWYLRDGNETEQAIASATAGTGRRSRLCQSVGGAGVFPHGGESIGGSGECFQQGARSLSGLSSAEDHHGNHLRHPGEHPSLSGSTNEGRLFTARTDEPSRGRRVK